MSGEELTRLHAIVEGRVQGVGFRYFVQDCAAALHVKGWVRNRWDETVEVTAEGGRVALEKLLNFLHKGPRSAYVSQVKAEWLPATGEFSSFQVRSTY